jgi:hypothetical protein
MNSANLRKGINGALLTLSLLFGLTIMTSLTAQAQYRNRDGYGYGQDVYRIAADQGYRDGVNRGAEDARDNDRYNPEGTSQYKDGKNGHRSEYGNKEAYKQAYREGFRRGYDVGFRQYANNRQGRGRNDDPYYGRNDDYGRSGDYGGYGRNDIYRVAQEQGYRDGVEQGAEHARDGKRFDPEGTRRYKNADQGYRSEYGNKEEYKQAYRGSFRQGYEEGYRRDYRGDSNGRSNNTRDTVISILGAVLGSRF